MTLEQLREQVDSLSRQLAERTAAERQAQIQALPIDQRSAAMRQLELEAEANANAQRRNELNQAALAIRARELSFELGRPATDFMKFQSITEMNAAALEAVTSMKPEEIVQVQARRAGTPVPATAASDAGALGAAGADRAPASAAPTGAGGGGAPGRDASAELLKEYAGKGSDSVGDYLNKLMGTTPQASVIFGGEPTANPTGASPTSPSSPSNAATPAPSPSVQTQPTPAGVS